MLVLLLIRVLLITLLLLMLCWCRIIAPLHCYNLRWQILHLNRLSLHTHERRHIHLIVGKFAEHAIFREIWLPASVRWVDSLISNLCPFHFQSQRILAKKKISYFFLHSQENDSRKSKIKAEKIKLNLYPIQNKFFNSIKKMYSSQKAEHAPCLSNKSCQS